MIKKLRKIFLFIWLFVLVSVGIYIFLHPELLKPENLLAFFRSFGGWALVIYTGIFLIRGLILIPSTPLIAAGVLLFPDNLGLVYIISLTGILLSSFIIYEFSDIMGFDEYFVKHLENKKIHKAIEKYGFFAVAFWSFFLILPTDLICYIAGTVRMNLYKFLLAVALGEGLVIGIVIFSGVKFLSHL